MTIPNVSREAVEAAMAEFDANLRSHDEWAKWHTNRAQTYAILHNEQLYPPKKIIAMATETPVSSFSGGMEANSYLEERGFVVQRLRDSKLQEIFELILERYGAARQTEGFAGNHEISELFARARRVLLESEIVKTRATLHVVASYGRGNWATIPWIAVLDDRETKTVQEGTYLVFLFREDGSGCYLKIAQGVTRVEQEYGVRALPMLAERAVQMRAELTDLADSGFDLSGKSDLGTDHRLGRLYEASTVASKLYLRGSIPDDQTLLNDVDVLLKAYERLLDSSKRATGPVLDTRPIALVGTWKTVLEEAEAVQEKIAARGGWASPWSFPIKPGARLNAPFHLYANGGQGRLVARLVVDELATGSAEGMLTPWPDLTDVEWQAETRQGDKKSERFRTWFRVTDVELLDPPLQVHDLDLVVGLSTPENVLSQSTFGYVYDPVQSDQIGRVETQSSNCDFDWLVGNTGLAPALLKEILHSIRGPFPQILLAGPPGTSKTWVARNLARHLVSDRQEYIRFVQFHPSYSYESFMEGLRPVTDGTGISFALTPGVVLETVNRMQRNGHIGNPAQPYVIVIDEINRANLPRVLGELMFLFEYRGASIRLQYSDEFKLPSNLYFIGTMNTADQSIRSIDTALRRRFDTFELMPDRDILSRYFGAGQTVPDGLVEGFVALNETLEQSVGKHQTIGHAYFMIPDPSWADVLRAWERRIYPLIEEYFFDQPLIAKEFTIDRFWPGYLK